MSTQCVVGISRDAALEILFETTWHPEKTSCCDRRIEAGTRFCPYCGSAVGGRFAKLRDAILLRDAVVPVTPYYTEGGVPVSDIGTLDFVVVRLLKQLTIVMKYEQQGIGPIDWVTSNTHSAHILMIPVGGIPIGPWNLGGPFQRGVLMKLKAAIRILPEDTSADVPMGITRFLAP